MAATASPTPFALHASVSATRYPSNRLTLRAMRARSQQSRTSPEAPHLRQNYVRPATSDSSDDEDLAPIKLSAEAQAILGEDNGASDKENMAPRVRESDSDADGKQGRLSMTWATSQQMVTGDDGSPAPRVVRIEGKRPSPRTTLARDGSFMYKIHDKSVTAKDSVHESKTPAPQMRRIRVSGSRSQTRTSPNSHSTGRSDGSNRRLANGYHSPDEDARRTTPDGELPAMGSSTITRPRRGDEHGIHSTMRVRRIGTGTLLNGPIRRGMIRRQSDEEDEPIDYKREDPESPEIEQGRRAGEADLPDLPDIIPNPYGDLQNLADSMQGRDEAVNRERQASPLGDASQDQRSPPQPKAFARSAALSRPTPLSVKDEPISKSSGSNRNPIFRIPVPLQLESAHDQENEPPPTFKRPKPVVSLLEAQEDKAHGDDELKASSNQQQQQQQPQQSIASTSPSRRPLVARSNNTPHRPAPAPPPKMSLIEAATSNPGNARSKKSVHYVLNNRTYRRLDCIGRGGSSRVFRIMAENYKIFALKRVNLEEADMAAIAGYKGEIDLLQKLSNVDRVIRLFDYEVNEEKGVLSVMMELGESDFNKMLNEQLKGENAKLDITFTRHYWKEMLECVQAVHDHDIVHSDLKPANFLLVKGQLKLIDFGIANAIQDNTVNVHRENQIGTPNYMSPESLVAHTPAAGSVTGQKILKLGKPSDVWSLGCILYQMTYGQPPFAHISKQFERIMSIPNPKVEIQFPTTGIGGAVVPFGLIKTLRRCLTREQSLRPTITELLSPSDPFLNPVAISPDMLGRVIGNVIGYCRKREEALKKEGVLVLGQGPDGGVVSCLPKDEDMRGWPGAFYEKLRQAQEEGSAW